VGKARSTDGPGGEHLTLGGVFHKKGGGLEGVNPAGGAKREILGVKGGTKGAQKFHRERLQKGKYEQSESSPGCVEKATQTKKGRDDRTIAFKNS